MIDYHQLKEKELKEYLKNRFNTSDKDITKKLNKIKKITKGFKLIIKEC